MLSRTRSQGQTGKLLVFLEFLIITGANITAEVRIV
jgi:hypothetical protein